MGFPRQEYWSGQPSPSSKESSWPGDWTWISHIAGRFFTVWTKTHKYYQMKVSFACFCSFPSSPRFPSQTLPPCPKRLKSRPGTPGKIKLLKETPPPNCYFPWLVWHPCSLPVGLISASDSLQLWIVSLVVRLRRSSLWDPGLGGEIRVWMTAFPGVRADLCQDRWIEGDAIISSVHRSISPDSISPVDVLRFPSTTHASRQKLCREELKEGESCPMGDN